METPYRQKEGSYTCLINGCFENIENVTVSVLDRGFLFADGVYEVIRVYRGLAAHLDFHMERLSRSLDSMRIAGIHRDEIKNRVLQLVDQSELLEATVYIQITRGSAPKRTHAFPDTTTPTELLWIQPFEDPHREKRFTGASAITFPDLRWARVDIKTTNLIGNVFSSQAAKEKGALEAILFDRDFTVTEASHSNVFAVIDGVLRTHPLSQDILPGVTRGIVLLLAQERGIKVEEKAFTLDVMAKASEVFITGTLSEIIPIVEIDKREIGSGTVGPVAALLRDAFSYSLRK